MNDHLHELARSHFNEPVLLGFEVGRLVGYAEDDDDCYFVIDYPKYPTGRRVWHTCVGGYVFLDRLRGQEHVVSSQGEEWDDYVRTDNVLRLNGAPPVEEFVLRLERGTNPRWPTEAIDEALENQG
jgi:hypothetical protein